MKNEDIIKIMFPDGYPLEMTVKEMNNVIRRAKIGKTVELLTLPTVVVGVSIMIWRNIKK